MDKAITELLDKAEQERNVDTLFEVYKILKDGREDTATQSDPFNANKYVICAEIALELGKQDICESCIKLYFLKTPPNNEFLCRAYLCQAQLHTPENTNEQEKLEQCVGYLLKTASLAKTNKSWHFIVYNVSVLYMTLMRPYLKVNFRHLLAKSLHVIVKCLDETNDEDYLWRLELSLLLIEAHLDAGNRDDAVVVSHNIMKLTRLHLPLHCRKVFSMQVLHKLIDTSKISAMIKSSAELSIYYKILKLKSTKDSLSSDQIKFELDQILHTILEDDEFDSNSRSGSGSKNNKRHVLPLTRHEKNQLLVGLAQQALDLKHWQVTQQAFEAMEDAPEELRIEAKILKCEAMVMLSGEFVYSRLNIEKRLKAIDCLSELIQLAHRQANENLIQIGCVTMWNICLPLLQVNLRKKVRKVLLLVADKLETIDSLLWLLRCQVHIEVSKCEEDEDHIQSAIMHLLKAMSLDDTGAYKVRIEHMLKKMKMKALLYQVPQRVEDHARMIIEQVFSNQDDSSVEDIGVYLAKAGSLLSPDSFHLAMESEKFWLLSEREQTIENLAEKVDRYRKGIANVNGHMKHVEGTNKRERILLWADLVKTARKQNVWDITRTAARFCLLYDTDEWYSDKSSAFGVSPTKTNDSQLSNITQSGGTNTPGQASNAQGDVQNGMNLSNNNDVSLVIAEVNMLYAEALVQLLHGESLKLLGTPKLPLETKKKPKRYANEKQEQTSNEWSLYCSFIQELYNEIMSRFLRAAKYGCMLQQSWIVSNACIYVWNYSKHLMSTGNFSKVVLHYKPFFEVLQSVSNGIDHNVVCDFAYALAQGYIEQHIPKDVPKKTIPDSKIVATNNGRKSKLGGKSLLNVNAKTKGATIVPSTANIDSVSDLKAALEILEYTLALMNASDGVPSTSTHLLIRLWVLCKTLLSQPLAKNFAIDKDDSDMTRALCASEALILKSKDRFEVSPYPTLNEVISLINNAAWDSEITLLKLWSQLSVVSLDSKDYVNALQCADFAIGVGESLEQKKPVAGSNHLYKESQTMLSYAYLSKAQSLVVKLKSQPQTFREAVDMFVEACNHSRNASNYGLVMDIARHYWNMIQDTVCEKKHCVLLEKPTHQILNCIASVAEKLPQKEPSLDKQTKKTDNSEISQEMKNVSSASVKESQRGETCQSIIEDVDLQLRTSLYCLLYQTYIDMGNIEEGFNVIDQAIRLMPRTHHRLKLFKHRIVASALLGKPYQFDIEKFHDSDEMVYAEMWMKVANSVKKPCEISTAFVHAIEALNDNIYEKIDNVITYCEWLLNNNHVSNIITDQLETLVNALLDGQSDKEDIPSDIKHIQSVKQLDVLFQLFIILTELQTVERSQWTYMLSAVAIIERMFMVSILNAEDSIQEGIKPGEKPAKNIVRSKSSKDHVRLEKSSSKLSIPTTYESLALFRIPEKHTEYFSADKHELFISNNSISQPLVTFKFMRNLLELLTESGCHHLCVYVLVVMEILAYHVIDNPAVELFVHLFAKRLYDGMNMNDASEYHVSMTTNCLLAIEQNASSLSQHASQLDAKEVKAFEVVDIIDIYTECAEHLIEQSEIKVAVLLLHKAVALSESSGKKKSQLFIDYCNASIHFLKKDWGKVVALLDSQTFSSEINQKLWLKRMILLIRSLFHYYNESTSFQSHSSRLEFPKCVQIIEAAISQQENYSEKLKCASKSSNVMTARLHYELGMLFYSESQSIKYERNNNKRYELLNESRESLLKSLVLYEKSFNYIMLCKVLCMYASVKTEAVSLMIKSVENQEKLPEQSLQIKTALIELYTEVKCGVKNIEEIFSRISSVCTLSNMENVNLPISSLIMENKISVLKIMLQMITAELGDAKERRVVEESKLHIVRVIEGFVRSDNEASGADMTWRRVFNTVRDEAFHFISILKQESKKDKLLHSKTLMISGQIFNVVGRLEMADKIHPWVVSSEKDVNEKNIIFPYDIHSFTNLQTQSMNTMIQSLNIAITNKLTDVVCHTSYNLLECIGLQDSITTIQMLSLFQSASACLRFKKVLQYAFKDPYLSASACCFEKYTTMESCYKKSEKTDFEEQILKEQLFYRQLAVTSHHFDLLKEIPFQITFVILQHSPDFKYLYGAVLDKSLAVAATSSGQTKSKDGESKMRNDVVCCRTATNKTVLNSLLAMVQEFKETLACNRMKHIRLKKLKKYEDQYIQQTEPTSLDNGKIEAEMQTDFETIVIATEAYMGSIYKELHNHFSHGEHNNVVLLCDDHMMHLPIEALNIFKNSNIKSLSRDFSLQVFASRLKQEKSADGGRVSKADNAKGGANKGNKSKGGTDKNSQLGQTKGAKEMTIDKDNVIIDMSNLRYLLDPADEGGEDNHGIETTFEELLTALKNKTAKWSGHKGSESILNTRELQLLLQSSHTFLFNGYGAFSNILPPALIAPLNLNDCKVLFIFDRAQCCWEKHAEDIVKDAAKCMSDKWLEDPVNMSMLLSICGVSSFAMNQWDTSVSNNNSKMKHIFSGLFENGETLGGCLLQLYIDSIPQNKAETEKPTKAAGKKRSPTRSSRGDSNKSPTIDQTSPVVPDIQPNKVLSQKRSLDSYNLVLYGLPNVLCM